MRKNEKYYYENIVLRRCSSALVENLILLDQIDDSKSETKQTIWKCLDCLGKMEISNEK